MMHAVIRDEHDTTHFFGNVARNTLARLGQRVEAAAHREHDDPVRLDICVTHDDERTLHRVADRILHHLEHEGVVVTVVVRSSTRVPLH